MNGKMLMKKFVFFASFGVAGFSLASAGKQVLYSINMPTNPFQQPYYQLMVKNGNSNSTVTISTATTNSLLNNIFYGYGGVENNTKTYLNTDYAALYLDSSPNETNTYGIYIYGMSPYKVRGYTEGIAAGLYLQRPAQVNLPFSFTNSGGAPLTATFPDYTDTFLAFTGKDFYNSSQCSTENGCQQGSSCPQQTSCAAFAQQTAQAPCWYGLVPQLTLYGSYMTGEGTENPTQVTGTYQAINGAGGVYPYSLSYLSNNITCGLNVITLEAAGANQGGSYGSPTYNQSNPSPLVNYNVQNASNMAGWAPMNFLPSSTTGGIIRTRNYLIGFGSRYGIQSVCDTYGNPLSCLAFAPVIPPGFNTNVASGFDTSYSSRSGALTNCLPVADFGGNYSSSKNNFLSGSNLKLYDGSTTSGPISYFQVFAQNMQWFSTPPKALNPSYGTLYISPGTGVFSDAMQIAAMETPSASGNAPVFTGSVPNTAPVSGPIQLSGTAAGVGFSVPQGFLSVLTGNSFLQGAYLQATQSGTVGTGALSPKEEPFQYFQGVMPLSALAQLSLMPYLPVYLADPGTPLYQPGWNCCPTLNTFKPVLNQMCYGEQQAQMTNFLNTLSGD